jgi:hypothetical protein
MSSCFAARTARPAVFRRNLPKDGKVIVWLERKCTRLERGTIPISGFSALQVSKVVADKSVVAFSLNELETLAYHLG